MKMVNDKWQHLSDIIGYYLEPNQGEDSLMAVLLSGLLE